MLAGFFHKGSGLGDQIYRYITVRSIAKDKGFHFGMYNFHNWKGASFMDIDEGSSPRFADAPAQWTEKDVRENGVDIRSYDPEINFITDNTVIDGNFEDSKYWAHHMDDMVDWLRVEELQVPDDVCVIGFRGGEYASIPELFLGKDYWNLAVANMRHLGVTKFEVHTDDPALARQFFPDFTVIDNEQQAHSQHSQMGFNWRSIRYAKHAIIANSAFYPIPRLLKHHEDKNALTIAPRYWARRNQKIWARPSCYYPQFTYL